jgi:hypothetical protein
VLGSVTFGIVLRDKMDAAYTVDVLFTFIINKAENDTIIMD